MEQTLFILLFFLSYCQTSLKPRGLWNSHFSMAGLQGWDFPRVRPSFPHQTPSGIVSIQHAASLRAASSSYSHTICLLPPAAWAAWVSCHGLRVFKAVGPSQWLWEVAVTSHCLSSALRVLFQSPQLFVPRPVMFLKQHSKGSVRAPSRSIIRTWILSQSKAPMRKQ